MLSSLPLFLSFLVPEVDRSLLPSPSPSPSLFLCSSRSEPLLPLSFYAFLPAKDPLSSGCRWVYRQPVGISVSARSVVWGMDEFCKSPFFFSRPLPVVRLSPFSPACPGQPLARPCVCVCVLAALLKGRTGPLPLHKSVPFWPSRRDYVRASLRWMTRTSESAVE